MVKKHAIGTLLLVIMVLASSCMKQEEVFSCNPEINQWAKENKESFRGISRERLGMLPLDLQKAAYATLTPEEKYNVWMEKLELVKSEFISKTILDKIDSLNANIDARLFSNNRPREMYAYIKNWENEVLDKLIDSTTYAYCFFTLSTEDELEAIVKNPEKFDYSWIKLPENFDNYREEPGGGSNNLDCDCEWDITCRFSGDPNGFCQNSACIVTTTNCGLLYQYPCRKTCLETGGSGTQPIPGPGGGDN